VGVDVAVLPPTGKPPPVRRAELGIQLKGDNQNQH